MTIQKGGFFRSMAVYTVLNFLPAGLALLMTPLYTNHLRSTSEFAFITLSNFFYIFFVAIIGLGFDAAYAIKFFHYNKDSKKQFELFSTTATLISVVFLVVSIILFLFGDLFFSSVLYNTEFTFRKYGFLNLLLAYGMILNALLLSHYRNTYSLKAYAIQSVMIAVVPVVMQLICIFFVSNTALSVIAWRSYSSLAVSLLFILYFLRGRIVFRKELFRDMLKLSIPLAIYSVIILLFENVDRIVIERNFKDLKVLSVYGLALTFAGIAELVRSSFASALSPAIFHIMSGNGEKGGIIRYYRFFIWGMLLVFSLLMTMVEPVFRLFIHNPDFFDSLKFISLLMLAMIPKIYYSIYQIPLSFHTRVKWLPLINAVSLVTGLSAFFLSVSSVGIYAIIISLFLSRLLQAILTYIYLRTGGKVFDKEDFHFSFELMVTLVCSGLILAGSLIYLQYNFPFWLIGAFPLAFLSIVGYFRYGSYLHQAIDMIKSRLKGSGR